MVFVWFKHKCCVLTVLFQSDISLNSTLVLINKEGSVIAVTFWDCKCQYNYLLFPASDGLGKSGMSFYVAKLGNMLSTSTLNFKKGLNWMDGYVR